MIKGRFVVAISIILISSVISSCKKDSNQAEIDRGIIEAYVLDNGLNGQFTSSGLYYVIIEAGNSDHPSINSTVNVDYKGYYLNGVVFDENDNIEHGLSGFIQGWVEGLQLIGEGGKIKLIIPSNLAYGAIGSDSIGPNEVLSFDITLNYFFN